jgi:hypothetical protein
MLSIIAWIKKDSKQAKMTTKLQCSAVLAVFPLSTSLTHVNEDFVFFSERYCSFNLSKNLIVMV